VQRNRADKGKKPRRRTGRTPADESAPWPAREPYEDLHSDLPRPAYQNPLDPAERLADLVDALPARIAEVIENGIPEFVRHEVRRELEGPLRRKIKEELRAEFEERIDGIRRQRIMLDPARLVSSFLDQVSRLLEEEIADKAEVPSPQQISNMIKQGVLEAMRIRRMHLAQLAEIDRLVQDRRLDELPLLLRGWFVRAGLTQSCDVSGHPEYFTAVNGPEEGDHLEVIEPAYIDEATGQVIRAGRIRHTEKPARADHVPSGELR